MMKWKTPKMSLKKTNIRLFATIIFATLIILMLYHLPSSFNYHLYTPYYEFMDIQDDKKPFEGSRIFFHETSYIFAKTEQIVDLPPRQGCSVESAARQNPDSTIFLLFTKPIENGDIIFTLNTKSATIKELLKYPNIRIRTLNMKRYTKGTPMENFFTSGKLLNSVYPVSHTSDVLRYLSLWKFGGTYMDLDVVILKNLRILGDNFAAPESSLDVGNSIIGIGHEEIGRQVADGCIKEIRDNFDGKKWSHNGPGVITRVLHDFCGTENIQDMSTDKCKGFRILPTFTFYPVHYSNWRLFFDPSRFHSVMQLMNESYGVHLWNKLSAGTVIQKNQSQDVPYGYMANKFCPNVFREGGETF